MTRYFFDHLNRALENLIDWRCQACEEAVQVTPALDHATIDETTQDENETSRHNKPWRSWTTLVIGRVPWQKILSRLNYKI